MSKVHLSCINEQLSMTPGWLMERKRLCLVMNSIFSKPFSIYCAVVRHHLKSDITMTKSHLSIYIMWFMSLFTSMTILRITLPGLIRCKLNMLFTSLCLFYKFKLILVRWYLTKYLSNPIIVYPEIIIIVYSEIIMYWEQ